MAPLREPNTLSNHNSVSTTHLHLDLAIDFARKILSGHVVLSLITLVENVDRVVLDTSYVDVYAVEKEGEKLKFDIADRHQAFGSALTINLPEPIVAAGTKFNIKVLYATTEQCTAIQFLEPSQTVGKKHPYLFSQCETIHARSFVPCQDTPSIKLTYSAHIHSPLRALMSALQTGEETIRDDGLTTYKFEQRTTIPSYLIALAAGDLEGREIGPRSAVWSEPAVVDKAALEFSDTERFIATGESFLTPYEWGRYDLLVLPPSFPYESLSHLRNPNSPRCAVDVIIHEISHSWMGNLVTTKTWEHFWLNEGWTVFTERKIAGRIYGQAVGQFMSIIGWKALKESVELFGADSPATRINTDLTGIDPDDYFSSVPYGFNLLYHIEKTVGGPEVFEPYMKAHVQRFASKSITTEEWQEYMFEFFETQYGDEVVNKLKTIDFESWLRGTGMPPVDPGFDTTLADVCYALAKRWDEARDHEHLDFTSEDLTNFRSTQKIVFLERLTDLAPLPHRLLVRMDELYKLTPIGNADIRFRWQQLCLLADYEPIYPSVVEFVTEQGRMKFVRPLYRLLSLAKNGSELAKRTYLENKSFYHPIAAALIEKDIGLEK
ncbi:peptidase family M1-domain-containing protein [Endogone sp. FLAS-F59071]|nr:peptidase family M1-domain-containing protein [Endogone sp. FLAS-F59071]|eukprot:RUS20447.1 peptidase family M1-domain-containing protein [Endogone sp. FLAS-F59071]